MLRVIRVSSYFFKIAKRHEHSNRGKRVREKGKKNINFFLQIKCFSVPVVEEKRQTWDTVL
jgi:hypothetical protein